jgi:hypothetical protein
MSVGDSGHVMVIAAGMRTAAGVVVSRCSSTPMPADWEAGRQRYFTINWIQLAVTWAAFALFILALSFP